MRMGHSETPAITCGPVKSWTTRVHLGSPAGQPLGLLRSVSPGTGWAKAPGSQTALGQAASLRHRWLVVSSPYRTRHFPPLSAFQHCLSWAGLPVSALPSLLHARPKCQAALGCLPLDAPQDFTPTSTASFLCLCLPALRCSRRPTCCVPWTRGLAFSWLSSSTFLPELITPFRSIF